MLTLDITPLKHRRTRIVATIGPASHELDTLRALIQAGVDLFRLNFSHGDHSGHEATYGRIRAAAEAEDATVAILADLSGPKIRTGQFEGGGIDLAEGETVTVTTREVAGSAGLIPTGYAALPEDVDPGDRILLDDGQLELEVVSTEGTETTCRVVVGGRLKDRKGMNLPGVKLSTPALTDKDRADARFALSLGVDWLALSFVRRASDVTDLRALVTASGRSAGIVAKIEKPEALDEITGILEACDAIMVARGDLGVELPPEQVPLVQDALVERARGLHRPVIIATQMLDSMIRAPRATRAEVADVAHAVRSGADAVMLSGETATGAFPVEAVQTMDTVPPPTEGYLWDVGSFGSLTAHAELGVVPIDDPVSLAVARATAQLSRDLMVRAIVVVSSSGLTAAVVSAARPAAPILTVAPDVDVARRMRLFWGARPVVADPDSRGHLHSMARQVARDSGFCGPGQRILLVQGFRAGHPESAPSVTALVV